MQRERLRAFWFHRQGLDGSLDGASPAAVLERSGWARSVGGVGPYLTLQARAGIGRERADRAAADLEIHELPAARGCTYVVPAADFALALVLGQEGAKVPLRVAATIGVTAKEIDKLCERVVEALEAGPLDPDGIRKAVGKACRSLGEAGKKKGMTTTLPLALGLLQSEGRIRRVPVNGRLDQQRYRYVLWKPSPFLRTPPTPEEAAVELARRFFRWIGPATLQEFRGFSAFGVKVSQASIETLGLVPMESGSDRLMFPEDREALLAFKSPKSPIYALVSTLDGIVLHRRDLSMLLEDRDGSRKVMNDRSLATLGGLNDLPSHAILDRGRLVGLWEFDPEEGRIAWTSFGVDDPALAEAVARAERFVRDDLGDARSFSLDSPASRAPRIAALRKPA
ncbi:MAG TPA: crosslink repair DNA glycosylase YcaQ family protein [Candidatus Polarisedimenticolia bacterium]|nr:crosslink repair DNA glycosylase YcaQ family protein [Candidatus Polarisedimenticolia bacterium]